jgi:hypothetical protein
MMSGHYRRKRTEIIFADVFRAFYIHLILQCVRQLMGLFFRFIQEDPGRQTMTGSFNPIDVGEWSAFAYLGPTEKLFNAIAAHERETVRQLLQDETLDINRRDPVGRTPLHVAVLVKAEDICSDLIHAGARMTPRLASGRTALHIAAQMNLPVVIKKLLAQSASNEEKAKEAEAEKEREKAAAAKKDGDGDSDEEQPSSADDWSSDDDDEEKRTSKAAAKRVIALGEQPTLDDDDMPEDEMNTPDILDINAPDWDLRFPPLAFAIVSGSLQALEVLLDAGVDPKQAIMAKPNDYNTCTLHPLALATIIPDEKVAGEIVDRLLRAGASSSQADSTLYSVFHAFVNSGKVSLVEKLLANDPTSKAALNIPSFGNGNAVYPLVTATAKSMYAIVALLLAYGANTSFSPEDIDKAKKMFVFAVAFKSNGTDDKDIQVQPKPPVSLLCARPEAEPVRLSFRRASSRRSFSRYSELPVPSTRQTWRTDQRPVIALAWHRAL